MASKPTIAVALIVKNEAQHLKACLDTVSDWVDEIVILDSGSTDGTEQIARSFTDKFFVNFDWPGFGMQRQLAQQHVESDYVLWLDADERVTPELKLSILEAVNSDNSNTVYGLTRLSWGFGRYIRHCGWYPDKVLRLYRTRLTGYNDALVHEKVYVTKDVQVKILQGDLVHYTYNDMNHYLLKSAGYAKAWADQREKQGKTASLTQGLFHSVGCFIKMYFLRAGFLDGKQGLLISLLSAHSTFVKYADLWERTHTRSQSDQDKI
ncbi:glycosyltransferase family 2 protein [Vibrio sp. 10N.239.311.G01]|uniref:glycosyltransferase family 2 protein n=1 Tax=Vibrio sp. 10N.239.311.G01 TaxID=3229976 RepID=UPI00354FA8C3